MIKTGHSLTINILHIITKQRNINSFNYWELLFEFIFANVTRYQIQKIEWSWLIQNNSICITHSLLYFLLSDAGISDLFSLQQY